MSNSETILSEQTYNISGDAVQSATGDAYKGDGYYGRSDGFHTIQYTLTGFIGTLNIQATLALEPAEEDWFTVYTQDYNDDTGSYLTNFTGNYVWIRATLADWTAGTVNSIKLNH